MSVPQPLPSDFKVFLQQELVRRCRANPRYSLRAFARALGTHPASLSHLLRGNRPITFKTVLRLSERLGLSPQEVERFRPPSAAAERNSQDDVFKQLAQDAFEVVSDWYHDAILELIRVSHFKPNARWIARALDITPSEVNIAVERLKRLGLLEITPSGKWVDCSEMNAVTGGAFTTAARRSLQRQALRKSLAALENETWEKRDHSCLTMAIQSRDLPEAKERIRKFRRELCAYLQRPGARPDQVYQLAVGLYPLSKVESERDSREKRAEATA